MKKIAFFIIAAGAVIFSCKKNDSGTGQPVITKVRLVDTTKRDSTFTQAVPGTLVVIEGNNFSGVQAVLFNDTSAYFNPALCYQYEYHYYYSCNCPNSSNKSQCTQPH